MRFASLVGDRRGERLVANYAGSYTCDGKRNLSKPFAPGDWNRIRIYLVVHGGPFRSEENG
jgi:hypothetical protein